MEYINWLQNDIATNYNIKFIRLAHEIGDSGHLHTHVLVDFGKPFQTKNSRKFDCPFAPDGCNPHPNIKKIKTKSHWENETQYIAKEDPENKDLLKLDFSGNPVEKLWEEPTIQKAFMNYISYDKNGNTNFSDALGIKTLYGYKPKLNEFLEFPWEFKPYQNFILDYIQEKHDRDIVWFYDKNGKTGKSKFTKWLHLTGKMFCSSQMGGQYHFATILQGALEQGYDGTNLLFDFTRAKSSLEIYDPLEAAKNGFMTAVKYQGGAVFTDSMDDSNIIVFANFLPDIYKMSRDRWNHVYEIKQDGSYLPVSYERIQTRS
jgi:hypothetical protein